MIQKNTGIKKEEILKEPLIDSFIVMPA